MQARVRVKLHQQLFMCVATHLYSQHRINVLQHINTMFCYSDDYGLHHTIQQQSVKKKDFCK